MSAAAGEVVLDRASRAFEVRADPARTLKELFIGRRRGRHGPAAAVLAYIAVACVIAVLVGRALFRRLEGELAVVL